MPEVLTCQGGNQTWVIMTDCFKCDKCKFEKKIFPFWLNIAWMNKHKEAPDDPENDNREFCT